MDHPHKERIQTSSNYTNCSVKSVDNPLLPKNHGWKTVALSWSIFAFQRDTLWVGCHDLFDLSANVCSRRD